MPFAVSEGACSAMRWAWGVVFALILSGCANQSYVVLLPNEDGTVGKVLVTGNKGTTLLEKNQDGVLIDSSSGTTFVVSKDRIAKDFGAALAASPEKPFVFLLYFETGGTKLTPESRAEIPKILAEISRRPAPDLSITGHTDTVGSDDDNFALGLKRARFVAELFEEARIARERITVDSHGEKNPLIPTRDNTPEPRNRRVEATVR